MPQITDGVSHEARDCAAPKCSLKVSVTKRRCRPGDYFGPGFPQYSIYPSPLPFRTVVHGELSSHLDRAHHEEEDDRRHNEQARLPDLHGPR
jgi:hypothetical protein